MLRDFERLHPAVGLGSYPSFDSTGPEVELVLKSRDPHALAAAAAWLEGAVDDLLDR